MGIYKHGIKMLKVDYKQTFFYLISIIISSAVIFNAYNIMNTGGEAPLMGSEGQVAAFLLLSLIFLSMFFAFFANSYFLLGKTKEIAVGALNGIWSINLLKIFCLQNLIIVIIGSLLGLLLGVFVSPAFLFLSHRLLGIESSIFSFNLESCWSTFFIVLGIIYPYVIAGDYGYINSKEIKDMLLDQKQMYLPDNRAINYPSILYLFIYLIPLALLGLFFTLPKYVEPSFLAYFNIPLAIYGIQGLIRYYLPQKIVELKKKKFIHDKIKLIALSNLHYSLRKLNYLIVLLSISSVGLIYITGLYKNSNKLMIMGMWSYISAIFLISMSILYKSVIEASNRKRTFYQLKLLGYTLDEIKKVIREEVKLLYFVVAGVPLIHILTYLIIYERSGIITLTLASALLVIFLLILCVIATITYMAYKKLALENI